MEIRVCDLDQLCLACLLLVFLTPFAGGPAIVNTGSGPIQVGVFSFVPGSRDSDREFH